MVGSDSRPGREKAYVTVFSPRKNEGGGVGWGQRRGLSTVCANVEDLHLEKLCDSIEVINFVILGAQPRQLPIWED